MLISRFAVLASILAPLAAFSLGCTAEAAPVDPTSAEALEKAETLPHGCNYVEQVSTSEQGRMSTAERAVCSKARCSDLRPPAPDSYGASVGGYTYVSSKTTSYVEREDFVGTCEDPQPISCDYLANLGDPCADCLAHPVSCAPVYFCDHDPNCQAIAGCVQSCGDDAKCQKRCVDNGDPFAAKNFSDVLDFMAGACRAECIGE